MKNSIKKRQYGSVAIEFVFVFPVLLMLVYGGIFYGYMYFIQQSIVYAAQKGAEAAVAVDPTTTDSLLTLRQTQLGNAIMGVGGTGGALGWMSAANKAHVSICGTPAAGATTVACPITTVASAAIPAGTLTVTVDYCVLGCGGGGYDANN